MWTLKLNLMQLIRCDKKLQLHSRHVNSPWETETKLHPHSTNYIKFILIQKKKYPFPFFIISAQTFGGGKRENTDATVKVNNIWTFIVIVSAAWTHSTALCNTVTDGHHNYVAKWSISFISHSRLNPQPSDLSLCLLPTWTCYICLAIIYK